FPVPHQPETPLSTRCYTREEVLTRPSPLPKSPGVYGWWFRRIPGPIDASQCQQRDGLTLLYTGISPSRPPTNGKPPSTQNLHHRGRTHSPRSAEGPPGFKSPGVLRPAKLGFELRGVGWGPRRTFGTAGEASLSRWLGDNALVSWVVHPEPWVLEEVLIATL